MSATAVAESNIDAPVSLAFARFIDFAHWDAWMPADFRPISGPSRALQEGDRIKVALGGRRSIQLELQVLRVRLNEEICWRAGIPGLLRGDHSHLFANSQGSTRLRSEERFEGLLAFGPLGRFLVRGARKHAELTLASFAQYLRTAI